MTSRPIQIYLDSADYSNLSNPKVLEKDPRKKDTLDFLYKCVDDGVIEIRFSAFTVAEITHIDEDSRRYAVQRAKLLMDLTRGKTFRPVFDLFTQDAIYLGIKQTTGCDTLEFPQYAYLDNNDWIDKTRWSDFSAQFKAETLKQCRKIITSLQLPRHQKKYAEKNFFRKGRLSPEVLNIISNYYNSEESSRKDEFIFWQDFTSKEMLIGFLSGDVPDKLFTDTLLCNVMNVELFVPKICDYEPEIREKIVSVIREQGDRLIQNLKKALSFIEEGKRQLLEHGFLEDDLENRLKKQYDSIVLNSMREARKRTLSTIYNKDKDKIRRSGLRWQEWDRYIINSECGSIPSLDTMSTMLMQYFLDKMKDKYAKSSPSDGADILHAAYAPYCDILRADKRIVELTNKLSRFFSLKETVLLKNPEELPQAIKEMARLKGIPIGG